MDGRDGVGKDLRIMEWEHEVDLIRTVDRFVAEAVALAFPHQGVDGHATRSAWRNDS